MFPFNIDQIIKNSRDGNLFDQRNLFFYQKYRFVTIGENIRQKRTKKSLKTFKVSVKRIIPNYK